MKGRAATYHRVSTVDQDPTLAREQLRQAAARLELELLPEREIEETGSGAKFNRPGLERVLELARRGEITHLLVWKLDRFGRSVLDMLVNIEELGRAGVTFIAVTQGLEAGPRAGPMGRMMLHVMAAVAEFERTVISERTLLGLEGARRRGKVLGRPRGSKDSGPRRRASG